MKASLTEKKEHLEKLQQHNSRLEHEVKRYQEREKHLEKIRVLEKKKPWAVNIVIRLLSLLIVTRTVFRKTSVRTIGTTKMRMFFCQEYEELRKEFIEKKQKKAEVEKQLNETRKQNAPLENKKNKAGKEVQEHRDENRKLVMI